ncbi:MULTISPECIES: hypothetical protein [unclassified Lysobacter]
MEWDELENALAWFTSAPAEWIDSAGESLAAAAEWIWEVLQGDFNEEQSNAQMITGMVVSMIPGVDQLCDVRDVVANCRKINEDTSNTWAWIGLTITLIGLIPVLGSLAKGCFKILVASSRKATIRVAKNTVDTDLWKHTSYWVDVGIGKLNKHLDTPAVRATLRFMKLDNPYKWLAGKVREVAGALNVSLLTKAFDEIVSALRDLVDLIQRWGSAAMGSQAGQLLQMVLTIRRAANTQLAKVLRPVTNWLDRVARRLDVEADQAYRARVNSINPHFFKRPANEAELETFRRDKPDWVDEGSDLSYDALEDAPPGRLGYPDMGDTVKGPTKGGYKTFHGTLNAVAYPPGTVLYRIVDPKSYDNSICWMTKSEFDQLKSKAEWRRRFAVKAEWNSNGEYVTYTVPPGKGLKAWEGTVASQAYKNPTTKRAEYVLEGGARQIVLDPADLDVAYLGQRHATGWGYRSLAGEPLSLVGVPVLKNNLYASKD